MSFLPEGQRVGHLIYTIVIVFNYKYGTIQINKLFNKKY